MITTELHAKFEANNIKTQNSPTQAKDWGSSFGSFYWFAVYIVNVSRG